MSFKVILESDSPIRVSLGTIEPPPPPPEPPPPPPPPEEDNSPFVWPTDGPQYQVREQDRYFRVWAIPGSDVRMYGMQADAGNPLISSHHNAGIIQAGDWAGLRLWAPLDAPPALLRAILSGRA